MNTEYSEQDTERVRQGERSSAGIDTQQLAAAQAPAIAPAVAPTKIASRRGNLPALALLALGVLLILGQVFPGRAELTGGMVLLTIASCFLFFSFWRRIYGLLIPGAILAGLSVGVTFADMTDGVSVLWGLAFGFLAIYFVGRALFGVRNQWPIFPAVPLFGVGVIVAVSNLPGFLAGGLVWLPLLLIALGLYLGWGRNR